MHSLVKIGDTEFDVSSPGSQDTKIGSILLPRQIYIYVTHKVDNCFYKSQFIIDFSAHTISMSEGYTSRISARGMQISAQVNDYYLEHPEIYSEVIKAALSGFCTDTVDLSWI